ncbi:hypothetical protein GW17_00022080 [Ensete ventricosum]|nr:hypothetical protein GW17_00022080 [Ensete ventricosum]
MRVSNSMLWVGGPDWNNGREIRPAQTRRGSDAGSGEPVGNGGQLPMKAVRAPRFFDLEAAMQRRSRTSMHGYLSSLRAIEMDELTYRISFHNKTAVFEFPCRSSGMVKADTRTPPITLRKAARTFLST